MYDPVVLAKKYQIDWISEMAASRLRKLWPQSLMGWDRTQMQNLTRVANADVESDSYEWDDTVMSRLQEPVTASASRVNVLCPIPREQPDISNREDMYARVWEVPERNTSLQTT
ncbi:hypothetical protein K438DRAFT_1753293 [Mycena galopus ATCC 62051]|nr:hypothetical protein K438DRAFT_1753293 [Mycena galopus ATCC 62051]